MKYQNKQIKKMKKMYLDHEGSVISDGEAEEAWDNLCDVFRILLEWDREGKEKKNQPLKKEESDVI